MKWVIYILAVAILVIINQTIFNLYEFRGFIPNLLLLFTLATIVSFEEWDFIFLAIFGGLWMDVMLGLPVGSNILGLLIICLLMVWLLNQWLLATKNWRHFLGAILIGSIFMHLWIWFYSSAIQAIGWHWVSVDTEIMLKTLLPGLLANLLLAYPVFIFVELIAGLIGRWSRHKILT